MHQGGARNEATDWRVSDNQERAKRESMSPIILPSLSSLLVVPAINPTVHLLSLSTHLYPTSSTRWSGHDMSWIDLDANVTWITCSRSNAQMG